MRTPLVAGNWKMHHGPSAARAVAAEVASFSSSLQGVEVALFPPFVSIPAVVAAVTGSPVIVGAQNLFWESKGAFTGEVAPSMIVDAGASRVLVGHSERRHVFGESDEVVGRKLRAALAAGLGPVLCVGERLEERRGGATHEVLDRQVRLALEGLGTGELERITIAYEPVWAIGTGVNATPEECEEAHAHLRGRLEQWWGESIASSARILYGGSVKPDNAASLLDRPGVDGALVGGASLDAGSFQKIVEAAVRVGVK